MATLSEDVIVVKLALLCISFLANAFLILAHIVDPLRVFRNTSSMFVLNITVIDCTMSFMWLISTSLHYAGNIDFFRSTFGELWLSAVLRVATMSAIAYFSLCLELYCSISRPLWHRAKITHKLCRYWIIATWLVHLLIQELAIRLVRWPNFQTVFFVAYTGSFFVFIQFVNVATFISLKRQGKALRERRNINEATLKALEARRKNEKHFLTTIAILSIILTVTFLPYFVVHLFLTFRYSRPQTNEEFEDIWIFLDSFDHCLIIINAAANPFFYLWRLPKYMKTFKKLCMKCFEN